MTNLRFPILAITAAMICLSSNHMLNSALEYEIQVEVLAINVDRNVIAENDPLKEKVNAKLEKAAALQSVALSTRKVSIATAFFLASIAIISAVSEAIADKWKKL